MHFLKAVKFELIFNCVFIHIFQIHIIRSYDILFSQKEEEKQTLDIL